MTQNESAAPAVYASITAVTRALGREGISKDRKNVQQGYNFRGIDDIYNALSSELAAANLCIIPRVISRESIERQGRSGGALFYVTIHAEYDIVSAVDGSRHTASAYGEAMDSGDKATNKAMSAAYKYLCMQLFCIPTEGDNDADATTHEVASTGATFQKPATNGNSAPKNTEEAETRFYNRYASIVGGSKWADVQSYLQSRAPKPTTVEGWIAAADAVRGKQAAA
jgi:hypothetical protein